MSTLQPGFPEWSFKYLVSMQSLSFGWVGSVVWIRQAEGRVCSLLGEDTKRETVLI